MEQIQKTLIEKGLNENVQFVPGSISEAIPNYIMDNPELKIALLNIDLDEYDATMTTLEFLYPRLMPGGILILDNFYKYLAESKAVKDYFAPSKITINNFSVNNGPHYVVKP
jgi:predicted O-methyltransferase YrrM